MKTEQKILFVSDRGHLHSEPLGGVQVCTREFIEHFKTAGFDITPFPLISRPHFFTRLKIRCKVDVYEQYPHLNIMPKLFEAIEAIQPEIIVLNMANIAKFSKPIKQRYGSKLIVVLVSHGNESGDFLKEAAGELTSGSKTFPQQILHAYRLGAQLMHESFYRQFIDHVFCISKTEMELENWLGAKNVTFIPQVISPAFLDWKPMPRRVGCVGTLTHSPNLEGILRFIGALDEMDPGTKVKVRLVGATNEKIQHRLVKYKRIEHVGILDDEKLRNEAQTWSCFIHPIFWYSRGASMKLKQAIEWGIPILTTQPGARGYEWSTGSLMMAANERDMVRMLLNNLDSNSSLQEMAMQVKKIANNSPTQGEIAQMIRNRLIG